MSTLTRARQTSLLTAATVTLLLAFGWATLKQEPSGVLSFVHTSSTVAGWLGVVVTAYLLVTYFLGVWADLQMANLKGWFQRGAIADIEAKMKQDREQRQALSKNRIEKALRLKADADAVLRTYEEQSGPLLARSEEVARLLDALPPYGIGSENRRPLEAELKNLQEQLSALAATRKQRMAIPQAGLEDMADRSTLDDVWTMLAEEEALIASRKTVRRATMARLGVEVVFPSIYALGAVVASAWRLWTLVHVGSGTEIG